MTRRSMRLIAVRIAVVVAVLVSRSPAIAATDLDKFETVIGRSAQDGAKIPQSPKTACVCRSSPISVIVGGAGLLRRSVVTVSGTTRILIDCAVVAFDAAGNGIGSNTCSDYIALPK